MNDILAPFTTDPAPVILAIGALVTALAGAIALLANTFRKRIEARLDDNSAKLNIAADVQDKIHVAVNGGLAAAKAEIVALKLEVQRLRNLLPPPAGMSE